MSSKSDGDKGGEQGKAGGGLPSSFILNSDMAKIRQAELVVLKEEEKFGRYARDPSGRLVPMLQALTRLATLELRRDDKRPIDQPSVSIAFAPHAKNSDIGVIDDPWLPEEKQPDRFAGHPLLQQIDDDANHMDRGNMTGGVLSPITLKGTSTKTRRPQRGNIGSAIEFNRYRRKKTLADRLSEINTLREQIKQQRDFLDATRVKLKSGDKKRGTGGSVRAGSSTGGGVGGGTASSATGDFAGLGATSPPPSRGRVVSRGSVSFDLQGGSLTSDDFQLQQQQGALEEKGEGDAFDSTYNDSCAGEGEGARKEALLEKIRENDKSLQKELEKLSEEEKTVRRDLDHINKDDIRTVDIKGMERKATGSERSHEIERKRRMLTEEEAVRQGPPALEKSNAYDYYATKIQSTIRGWLTRCYARWYRAAARKASTCIQACARGKLGRMKVKTRKERTSSATKVQKIFRGYKARNVSAKLSKNKNLGLSAILIQKIFRGVRGKKRALAKRQLDNAADIAKKSVDPRAIYVSDVQELARRIQYAIEEPETSSYPPDEVLMLMRLSTVIMQQSRGQLGFSEYSYINARYYHEYEGEFLTWAQCVKMLNRSERMLKMMRSLAFGPASKPPRIVTISNNAKLMLSGYGASPNWQRKTFEEMGMGSKFCMQLFDWLNSIGEVAMRQASFLSFLATSFPDWLPQLYDIQREKRKAEFDFVLNERCIEALEDFKNRSADDMRLVGLCAKDQRVYKVENEMLGARLEVYSTKELDLGKAQGSREELAVVGMECKIDQGQRELAALSQELRLMMTADDTITREKVPQRRADLINLEMNVKELMTQVRLLKTQVESNKDTRLEVHPLSVDARLKAQAAGEAKALDHICQSKLTCFLEDCGVRHVDHLKPEYMYMYNVLDAARSKAHDEAWKAYVVADNLRKEQNDVMTKKVLDAQAKEIASKDNVKPSDEEMEEERREDEIRAREERFKQVQFIPDHAMYHPHPTRPRPVIIGLGRDLPGQAKSRIIQEITAKMPGLFVFLDSPTNMGLCVKEMQAVLDAKKSIIIMLDHGLSRMTRIGFLKSFEVTVRALIPNPFVVMAVGNDSNRRSSTGASHYGASKHDLQGMRDCDIKVGMEGMNWVLSSFLTNEVSAQMIRLAAEPVPPSQAFVTVVEGFFIMQSQAEAFVTPEAHMSAMSWRFTQRMLADPRMLVDKLRAVPRGSSSPKLVQCLAKYMENKNWPQPNSIERANDPLLHLFAAYVECFVNAEKATLERGGIPPIAMNRASMKGIQSVEVVVDSADPEDMVYSRDGGGWRMAAAKIIRIALQDLRTLKTVLRVNDNLLNVCAYRENELIYLDTYDAATSETHMCVVKIEQVAFLLMPNATMKDKGDDRPPQSALELYSALAKLLRMEPFLKSRADTRKRLTCRRDFTYLCQLSTKVNGHSAFIKCYEAALGQLYFTLYLPEYSAQCTYLVGEEQRLEFIGNADHHYEYQIAEDVDARKLLPFAIDRLKIAPNRSMIKVARGKQDLQEGYRKKQGKVSMLKAQGFRISMRVRGGCGKIVNRKIINFSGVPHILETRLLTVGRILILQVYEPRSRSSMRVTLKPYYRRLLLGSDADDFRNWLPALLKRVKIDWRGKHELVVDKTMLRVVRKVAGERLILSIALSADEDSPEGATVKLSLLNQQLSMTFTAEINKEQVIRLLLYSPPLDQIEKQFGVKVNKPAVRTILKNAKTAGSTKIDKSGRERDRDSDESSVDSSSGKSGQSKASKSKKGGKGAGGAGKETTSASGQQELHPSTFDVTLESVLSDHENLVKLANRLGVVLQLTNPDSIVFGYKCVTPVQFEMLPVQRYNKEKVSFNTNVRFEPRLKQSVREGTVEGVIRSRRQMPFTMMEEELNLLAQAKAEAYQRELEAIMAANKEVEAHFLGLSEEDYNKMAGVPGSGLANVVLDKEDKEELVDDLIDIATTIVADNLVGAIESKEDKRLVERQAPGTTQEVRRLAMMSGAGDGKQVVEVDANLLSKEEREIFGRGESKVFEGGVKTQFRDTRAVWSGHVAMKVFETMCWQGSDGVGRRLRFEVYEPSSGGYYDGLIRNNIHLKSIVGRHGLDLLIKNRTSELIMFIAKYKMFMSDNTVTWDGVKNEEGAPAWRVEFDAQRVYTEDKVTPINAGEVASEVANEDKLFDAELKRGKKICRLVRRVANLLMQVTVFEIATSPEDDEAVKNSPYGNDPLEGKSAEELELMALQSIGGKQPVNLDALNGGKTPSFGEGQAEQREVTKIKRHTPPTFKMVGYDPRSKRKAVYKVSPVALLEIAGGVYSPFLDPNRRRELAKIASDALTLTFPKGKPMELGMNWSGSGKETVVAEVKQTATVKSALSRSSAELVLKRTGKLFRSAVRLGRLECVVTLYVQTLPRANTGAGAPERQLVVNIYCRGASEATEIVLSSEEQIARLGRTIDSFPDGEVRTSAVRRFLRFLHADLIDDPTDPDDPNPKKILHAVLRPAGKDFLTEYAQVKEGVPGEEVRPIGCPTCFMPPNTCGRMLHRRGMSLQHRTKNVEEAEFLITVYTISDLTGPERGLVIKVYDKTTSEMAILHLGYGEMQRLCNEAGEPDLIRDVTNALQEVNRIQLDKAEEPFDYLTERGDASQAAKKILDLLIDIILSDIGVERSSTEHVIPYLKSQRRGFQIKLD